MIESETSVPGVDKALNFSSETQQGEAERSLRSSWTALSPWAHAGLLLSVLLIAFLSYLTLKSTRQAEEDSDWVMHTQMVQKALQSVLADAVDTVSGSRGFAITGQDTFLDLEDRSERRLGRDLELLHSSTADQGFQQERFGHLQQQVNTSLASTIKIETERQRTGKVSSDAELIESKRDLDAVRATVGEMQEKEAKLLVLHQDEARNARRLIRIIVPASTVMGMGLVTLSGLFLRREIKHGNRIYAHLRSLNANLERQSVESKRAEAEARRSELRLLGAAESSMDCLYFCDALRGPTGEIEDFVFTYLNTNATKLVTFSPEELIGGKMCEMFPMNRKLGLFEKYRHVVLTGEPFAGEFLIQEETIHTEWLRLQAVKLEDGVVVSASNITERKRQEAALHQSTALLERTERLTDTGGWELDLVAGELYWSAEVYRILGVARDYRPVLEEGIQFYVPEDRVRVRTAIETASAGGDAFDMECTVLRPDGTQVPVRLVGAAEFENGKPRLVTGAFKDITQQVAERSALKAAHDRLSLATNSGGIGIWDWDLANDTLSWDHRMYRLYGMEPGMGEEPYLLWRRHLHPDDRDAAERQLQDGLAGRRPFNTEFRIVWKDGSVHFLRATALVTRDEAGRAVRMVGANWDVTARKESELELAKLAALLQSIISSSPFAMIMVAADERITLINSQTEKLFQFTRQELVGQPFEMLLPARFRANHAGSFFTVSPASERVPARELFGLRHDGSELPVEITLNPIDTADGKFVLVSIVDLTERQKTERSLRDQALIIDMASEAVFIRDGKGAITYWNQGAHRLYGWSREEALGHVTRVLLKTQYPQPLADIEAHLLSQGSWNGELVHTRRDGSLVTLASSWNHRYDETTGELYILEINHDITARKAAELELARNRRELARGSLRLQAVNKELEEFAYIASHDLKAPLRVIDNASQWLEEDLAEHLTAETRETMKLLRGRVQRMGKLLDDLLDYARIGREVENHLSEAVAGDVLMNDVLALLPTSNFTIAVSPCLSGMQFLRMPLQQILSNLIANAIKHHDKPEGRIELTVKECGESYEFAVHDDGPGIAPQFHEQIFKMFQTLQPRDKVEGSGMGLSLARKTVESFGGKLRVESAEGQGCTFRFTWPKDQRSAREAWSNEVFHSTYPTTA